MNNDTHSTFISQKHHLAADIMHIIRIPIILHSLASAFDERRARETKY